MTLIEQRDAIGGLVGIFGEKKVSTRRQSPGLGLFSKRPVWKKKGKKGKRREGKEGEGS